MVFGSSILSGVALAALAVAQASVVPALGAAAGWTYNSTQAVTSLWFSMAAFCPKDTYLTRTYTGPSTGFKATKVLHDAATDATGYIGYLPSDKSIYVVFRGTDSTRNWIDDLNVFKTAYTSYPECNCQVHKGFYKTEQSVIGAAVTEVGRLLSLHPTYQVKVTGHSLGAALSQLAAMDLVKAGFPTTLYNFGQPRVGDQAYAAFSTGKLKTFRVVHNKDDVPHMPVTAGMEFYHACTEVFEDVSGTVRTCSTTNCEDPTCSDQFKATEVNGDDHMVYLGYPISCNTVS